MANAIKFAGTITPANTPCEGSHDGGVTYRPVPITTVGAGQEGILTNVPAGTYAAGTAKLRAIGYPASVQSWPAALTVLGAAAWNGKPVLIVTMGDSTTQGVLGATPVDPATSYPGRLAVALGGNYVVTNLGVGGTDTQNMLDRGVNEVDTLFSLNTYSYCVFVLHGGINDYYNSHTPASTAAGVIDRLRQNLAARKARGFYSAGMTVITSSQPFESDILNVNVGIRQFVANANADLVIDTRTDNGLNVLTNTNFYDSIHPNQLGYQKMAKVAWAALKPVFEGWGVPVPAYTFPYEAPADTVAPSAPGQPTASATTATATTLTWAASTDNVGVVLYEVFDQAGAGRGTATGTSLTVTGLTAATAYSFTVKARDAAGNVSAASLARAVTTAAAPAAGPVPVTWIELGSGATASGNTLSGPNGGIAYSSQIIGPSAVQVRGWLETTLGAQPADVVLGLSNQSHQSNGYSDIPMGWYIQGTQWKEFGTLIPGASSRPGTVGDVLRMQIEATGIRYLLNGTEVVFYALTAPAADLQVDFFMLGTSTINNVTIYAANLKTAP